MAGGGGIPPPECVRGTCPRARRASVPGSVMDGGLPHGRDGGETVRDGVVAAELAQDVLGMEGGAAPGGS